MQSHYVGTELDVFALARNWKAYLRQIVAGYLRGSVLEVGAGIGGTTLAFRTSDQTRWTALEPDPRLASRLRERVVGLPHVDIVVGALAAIREEPLFHCILYVDVLEHIPDDAAELQHAARRLLPGGVILVISPAHQFLFTPFDAAIGHCRRYDRDTLRALAPADTDATHLRYVDSVGMCLSLGNRLLLRSASPSAVQVRIWDRWCIPLSRHLDAITAGRVGKSIIAVYRKRASGPTAGAG